MPTIHKNLAAGSIAALLATTLASHSLANAQGTVECSISAASPGETECDFPADKLTGNFTLTFLSGGQCSDPMQTTATFTPNNIQCNNPKKILGNGTQWACDTGAALVDVNTLQMDFKCPTAAGSPLTSQLNKRNIKPPSQQPNPKAAGEIAHLAELPPPVWRDALRSLGLPLEGRRFGNYYDRGDDVAVIFLNASGAPFFPLPDVIDEDDDLYVVVADREDLVKSAEIALNGCNRPPVQPRVFSSRPATEKTSAGEIPVRYVIRPFGKCAGAESGGPQLTVGGNNTVIRVNPLYRFAVGVAAAYDNTGVREYSVRTPPGEGISRVAQASDKIGLSSLVYVSFYPWARDFRKTDFFLAQRAQLFVGLDPRAFDEHLVVGLGYELTQGFNVLGGWRFLTKQPVLAEGSGVKIGDPFDGPLESLPTRKRWELGSVFVGLGLSSELLGRLR